MRFYKCDDSERIKRTLIPETGRLKVILDTDTYNEIDDQFAIFYSLFSEERIELLGVHAALFYNDRSTSPADGMEKSYQEIRKVLKLAQRDESMAYRGCTEPLENNEEYQESDAVNHMIECAMMCTSENPLYVVGIGAATNIASAIIKEPAIMERIVVIWLGGNSSEWPDGAEFNYSNDPVAGQVLFDCGVPFIQVPAFGVTGFLTTSIPELETCLYGVNTIGDYLVKNVKEYNKEHFAWTKAIWDIGAVAILINPKVAVTKIVPAPWITDEGRYAADPMRHLMRRVCILDRDEIFKDMYQRIRKFER